MRFVILFLALALNCLGQEFNGLADLSAGGVPVAAGGGGAITLDAVTNSAATTGGGAETFSFTCSGANRYLLLAVETYIATVTSATYDGSAMTLLGYTNLPGLPNLQLYLYGLVAPSSGTHNFVLTTAVSSDRSFSLMNWTGVNQSTPYNALATNAVGGAASPTALTIASGTGKVVVDCVTVYGTAPTPDGTQTVIANIDSGADNGRFGASYTNGVASVSMAWTYSSSRFWETMAISLQQ